MPGFGRGIHTRAGNRQCFSRVPWVNDPQVVWLLLIMCACRLAKVARSIASQRVELCAPFWAPQGSGVFTGVVESGTFCLWIGVQGYRSFLSDTTCFFGNQKIDLDFSEKGLNNCQIVLDILEGHSGNDWGSTATQKQPKKQQNKQRKQQRRQQTAGEAVQTFWKVKSGQRLVFPRSAT